MIRKFSNFCHDYASNIVILDKSPNVVFSDILCRHIQPTCESGFNQLVRNVYLQLSIVAYHDIHSQISGVAGCDSTTNLCIFF